jgi:glyceraldehyde 3-phosphate dehydrogenase
MAKKIAINGFGRIGRAVLKGSIDMGELEYVAINDLGDIENLAYLLRYDSVYGRYDKEVSIKEENGRKYLVVNGKQILFLQEKDPSKLPWGDLDVDIVIEATGVFASYEKSQVHLDAGAKRVVITAPSKDEDNEIGKTVLLGVNEDKFNSCTISSNGSCTTNSASPVIQILVEALGVKKAFLAATHGYTATQTLIDGPSKGKDYRRGRAAAWNIVPSSTGAAVAVARGVTEIQGRFDGIAIRVPVVDGSVSSIVCMSERPTTVEEINEIFKKAAQDERWKDILSVTEDPIVSSDIIGQKFGAIIDLSMTKVIDGDMVCVLSWYDNEEGYTQTLIGHILKVAKTL